MKVDENTTAERTQVDYNDTGDEQIDGGSVLFEGSNDAIALLELIDCRTCGKDSPCLPIGGLEQSTRLSNAIFSTRDSTPSSTPARASCFSSRFSAGITRSENTSSSCGSEKRTTTDEADRLGGMHLLTEPSLREPVGPNFPEASGVSDLIL